MILNVLNYDSDNDDFFIIEFGYFTISHSNIIKFVSGIEKYCTPFVRFYLSDFGMRLYLSSSNYSLFYNFSRKVGWLC